MTHIMLDLETWGTTPGSDIRSIGACVFAPETGLVHDGSLGTIRPFYLACDNPMIMDPTGDDGMIYIYPLTRNPDTIKWWSGQSPEAQAAFADPVDLCEALDQFHNWLSVITGCIGGVANDLRLWSHGAAFDAPILAVAYDACDLPVPWHYRAPRDTRTLFDAAGIDDHSAWLAQHPGPLGVSHHALDDAICQARAVCAAWKRISAPQPYPPPLDDES